MVDYQKEIEKMIQELKQENPEREIQFKEGYALNANGKKIPVSLLEIKEPMEKDDEKTNISKKQILFKTKDGYVLIAEVTQDNEIVFYPEGLEEAGIEIELKSSNKIELTQEEKEKNSDKGKAEEKKEGDQEKDDQEKPKLDQDRSKEEIAKQYNVNSNQVIHIAKDEKVTEDHRFDGIAEFTREYDDIFIIQGEDPYSWKTIGTKEGKQEEIKRDNKQIGGKNPDITIKRIDGEKITEVRPLFMYELDNETAVAIVKDSQGKPEALYCRQEGGDEKTYWGAIIPEASGKNVMQESPDTREFMDRRNNSNQDLVEKAKALEEAESLEKRGAPSKESGVQVYEIDGTHEQNRALRKAEIVEDLMKRDGILDRATVPPGFYEAKAEKVLKLMEENEGIDYEEAVERIEKQNKRDEGGKTPDQKRNREG